MKYRRVSGEITVQFNVELPAATAYEPVICDNPAVEVALQVAGHQHIYLWGEDKDPAIIDFDAHEEDVVVEEDEEVD